MEGSGTGTCACVGGACCCDVVLLYMVSFGDSNDGDVVREEVVSTRLDDGGGSR